MNPEFGTLDPEVAEAVMTAETTAENLGTPKVVGKGVYLELVLPDNSQTTQVIFTPAGQDEKGKTVPMTIVYRTVSKWSPRKQWRVNIVRISEPDITPENKVEEMTNQVSRWLERQLAYGGAGISLREKPIVFEITNIDLTDVSEWKAPASALRRITKARTALNFPTDLYAN
jgi:hypothetical protein